jgi:hypothetical protein
MPAFAQLETALAKVLEGELVTSKREPLAEAVAPAPDLDELLSIRDVAGMLDYPETLVTTVLNGRELPSQKVGKERFIRRRDLEAHCETFAQK